MKKNNATSASKVVVNSIVYSLSGILLKCFNFFLIPLYSRFLTPDDYGITNIANSFMYTMAFIIALSVDSAIMRFYVDYKNDPETLKRFYGTGTVFALSSGIVWAGIFFLTRGWLSETIFSGTSFFPIIFICILELIFSCLSSIFQSILTSQQKAMLISAISIITFIVKAGLNILFVVVLRMGAVGTLLANAIVTIVYVIAHGAYLLATDQMKLCMDFKLLGASLKYSIPLIPHHLSTRLAMLVSNVLIGGVRSLASLGVYSIAAQFGDVADNIQSYVNAAYQPWVFEKLSANEEGYQKSIRETAKMLIAVLGLLFIGIALFSSDYILLFVDRDFVDAKNYIPLIVLMYAMKTAYYFFVVVLLYNKSASKWLFTATLSGSLINVILSYILIPAYGVWGSIFADGTSIFIRIVVIVLLSKKYENTGLKVRDFVSGFLVVFAFIVAGVLPSFLHNQTEFSLLIFSYKILVTLVYIAVMAIIYRKQLIPLMNNFKMKLKRK